MATTSNAKLVIGRGSLFFDRFILGTFIGEGEMYFGNTTTFTIDRQTTEISKFVSYGGKKFLQKKVVTGEVHSGKIETDNIDMQNVALWFGNATIDDSGQSPIGEIVETYVVKRGRFYQLGKSVEPAGARHIEPSLVVRRGISVIPESGNFSFDPVQGRIFILETASDIFNGDILSFTFEWSRSPSTTVSSVPDEVRGALRFIADNITGENKNIYLPYVAIKPSSDFNLKNDDWQKFNFEFEVRKLNPTVESIYITEVSEVGEYTFDEESIVEFSGVTLDDFPYWEDQLDTITNIDLPETFAGL